MKSDLLKEAIADAKAVKETALANAKMALEEAFTPKLQSMLSHKLAEELDDEEEVEEELDASGIGAADNAEPSDDAADSSDIENDDELTEEDEMEEELDSDEEEEVADIASDEVESHEEEMHDEEGSEEAEEDEVEEMYEEEDESEEDELDLESVIAELEAALDGEEVSEEEDAEEMSEEEDMDEEEDVEEMYEEEDEELSLEEIINTLKEMADEEEVSEEEDAEEVSEEEEAAAELEEAYKTIESLRATINEVNLLNAKLLYTNKLFRTFDLNEGQKMKVIENFDRAASLREVKLVFATLGENLNVAKKPKTVVKESLASKPMKSSAPKKEIISEGNVVADRFKKLAGLIK